MNLHLVVVFFQRWNRSWIEHDSPSYRSFAWHTRHCPQSASCSSPPGSAVSSTSHWIGPRSDPDLAVTCLKHMTSEWAESHTPPIACSRCFSLGSALYSRCQALTWLRSRLVYRSHFAGLARISCSWCWEVPLLSFFRGWGLLSDLSFAHALL